MSENTHAGDDTLVLTVCIAASDPAEYRLSECYRSILASVLNHNVRLAWIAKDPDALNIQAAIDACESKYIIFIEEEHTFSLDYFQVLTDHLLAQPVFLADSYRYADTIPTKHNKELLTTKYYYRRDTDIWGVAYHAKMLREFLLSTPGMDRQSIYTSFRLFYFLNQVDPLPIGYSTHDDTKNVNGIALSKHSSRILVQLEKPSQELQVYAVKLLISVLRGLQDGDRCSLSVQEIREAARSYATDEIAEFIPLPDRIEFGALRYLADPRMCRSYVHKRLGEFDVVMEFSEEPPGAESTLLYHYRFSDFEFYVSKRYIEHSAVAAPEIIDHYRRKISTDSIILFFDRSIQADDNAEALYKYFSDNYPQYHNAYFALSIKSPDWNRLALAGFRLVPMFSADFYDKFLHADLVVSSQIYSVQSEGKDFSNSRFVYLQHGVMMNDMRQWIVSKCFDLFITTGEPETEYLRGLAPRETINSGIPRLETLQRKPHNGRNFVYMPTWRFDLGKVSDDAFVESDYFQAIERLLQDPNLEDYLERANATVWVKLHPNFEKRSHLFSSSERVQLSTDRYSQLIGKADFIFTDYSSVVLDAAYVGIPIAYYQFDRDTFFSNQPYTERMDYEMEGLGPVFLQKEQMVAYITSESYLEPDPVYAERYEFFFRGVPTGHIRETIIERMLAL